MPTLQSLRVAPELLQKLRDDVQPPILTPLALLARDPASTAKQLRVPLSYWNQVRAHVADAILLQTSADTVRIAAQQLEHDKQEDVNNNNNNNNNNNYKNLIIGSLTALQYWRHSQTRHASAVAIPRCTVLSSWLSSSRLIQITGPSASGKTQVCLSLAVSSLQHDQHHQHQQQQQQQQHRRVLYISTTTPPSALARRLRQLVASPQSGQQRHVLDNINLMHLSTPHQLLTTLHQVAEEVADSPKKSLLLILDSASGCLGGCSDWNLLTRIGVTLKRLVHLTTAGEVRIVMTNGTTASGDSALGATWSARVPETHLRLAASGPLVEATLRRNSHGPVETTHFTISADGIQEELVGPC